MLYIYSCYVATLNYRLHNILVIYSNYECCNACAVSRCEKFC